MIIYWRIISIISAAFCIYAMASGGTEIAKTLSVIMIFISSGVADILTEIREGGEK